MKWILLGASRGLGKAFAEAIHIKKPHDEYFVASRRSAWKMNFAEKENWPRYIEEIIHHRPHKIIYFAGGGPFGNYSDKNWQDHEWAFKVNFEFPAFMIHSLAQSKYFDFQQVCLVGSSVAENSADPGAASYSSAKHALVGLVKSLHTENSLNFDLRLFSPGYMDTDLLPANAWPRQKANLVKATKPTAEILFDWLLEDSKRNSHLVIPPHY